MTLGVLSLYREARTDPAQRRHPGSYVIFEQESCYLGAQFARCLNLWQGHDLVKFNLLKNMQQAFEFF